MSAQPLHSVQPSVLQGDGRLDATLDRLRRATSLLEAAVRRRAVAEKSVAEIEQELQVLVEDRSRLAHELDQVKAKASRLDSASAEVSTRLDSVMANLRSVLAGA